TRSARMALPTSTGPPVESRAGGTGSGLAGCGSVMIARGSFHARALRKSPRSLTVRAIGPSRLNVDQPSTVGHVGTRPVEGRMPATPQKLAGLRSEPPISVPSAIGTMPQASATAPPPVLPPHVFVRSYGLRVEPNTGLKVCDPAPNSGVFVLPTTSAPALLVRSTSNELRAGTKSL